MQAPRHRGQDPAPSEPLSQASPAAGGRRATALQRVRNAGGRIEQELPGGWTGPEGSAGDLVCLGDSVQGRGRVLRWVSGRVSGLDLGSGGCGGRGPSRRAAPCPPGQCMAQTPPGLAVSPPTPAPPLVRPLSSPDVLAWVPPQASPGTDGLARIHGLSPRSLDLRCTAHNQSTGGTYLELMQLITFLKQ